MMVAMMYYRKDRAEGRFVNDPSDVSECLHAGEDVFHEKEVLRTED